MLVSAACSPCRPVETRALAIDCAETAPFEGERHFDRSEPFTTFLTQECGLAVDASAEIVASIDFDVDAVVVARGERFANNRCINDRDAAAVEVCDAGLRIEFNDVESADQTCQGLWTVAVVVARGDLRTALAD